MKMNNPTLWTPELKTPEQSESQQREAGRGRQRPENSQDIHPHKHAGGVMEEKESYIY